MSTQEQEEAKQSFTFVVLGASGDLAKKKTYPALFALFSNNLLPAHSIIYGFARSELTDEKFREFIAPRLKGSGDKEKFLAKCFYYHGQYDSQEAFAKLDKILLAKEQETKLEKTNRIFYLAIPPSVFVAAAKSISSSCETKRGWNRVIVEKPFGNDVASSSELSQQLGALFTEEQLYRIDHYLGKEMVQNLMVLRFANSVFEPVWNRFHIANVTITFKEDIGTEGRGGYFDQYGIIRDVMQNHLTQILSLVGMEPPVSLDAEDVRNEKVKLLRAIPPIKLSEVVLGQYGPSPDGKQVGYLDDKTVPKGSVAATFASAVLFINNSRWKGVPFILKCGKALDDRKAEIRIQFQQPAYGLFKDTQPNELVIRLQPNEAMYMKLTQKKPGLTAELDQSELDLTYRARFGAISLPDAYERLILDVIRGDHNLFVRSDELEASWKIFTPLLHKIDETKIQPEPYAFGSRGPAAADELAKKHGFKRTEGYVWPGSNTPKL